MKKAFVLFSLIAFVLIAACFLVQSSSAKSVKSTITTFKDGDIIFQSSQSKQCTAVQLATHSIYSHCGIIFIENNKTMVYEAVQPVRITPFDQWIKWGKDGKYVVKRLKNAETSLTPEVVKKMKEVGNKFLNKNYDIYFGWSNDMIYCSELVWKIYKQGAGIEVGKLQKLKDFDLTSEEVKAIMKERYGSKIPYDETVISPISIFNSDLLVTVQEK